MTDTHGDPDIDTYDRLRSSARDLINHGVPPSSRGGTLSVGALQLLYERASRPESAADASKLLHELQTYQVELDLMYEQLQANELEVSEELAHYRSLYNNAPAPYLIVANDGEIIEGNQAAVELLGRPASELPGKSLSAFIAKGQETRLETVIGHRENGITVTAAIELSDGRQAEISARPSAAGDSILMILTTTPSSLSSLSSPKSVAVS